MFCTTHTTEFLVLLLMPFITETALDLSYDELRDLGVSCPPFDSCRNRTDDSLGEFSMTCECDRSCARRGTCCIDSEFVDVSLPVAKQSCIPLPTINSPCPNDHNFLIVLKCSPSWNGSSAVRKLCEGDARKIGNFFMLVPVDNPVSGYTYKNYFCAVCNHDNKGAVLWSVTSNLRLDIASLDPCTQELQKDIEYNANLGWGYWNHFAPGEAIFIPVLFRVANIYLESFQRETCREDVVWKCSPDWRDESIRKKCEAYTALIHGPGGLFRNVHCAICNFASGPDNYFCTPFFRKYRTYDCAQQSHGPGGIVVNILGQQLKTQECQEAGKEYTKEFEGCRPNFCPRGDC